MFAPHLCATPVRPLLTRTGFTAASCFGLLPSGRSSRSVLLLVREQNTEVKRVNTKVSTTAQTQSQVSGLGE